MTDERDERSAVVDGWGSAGAEEAPAGTDSDSAAQNAAKRETPWYIEIPLVVVSTFVAIFLIYTFIGRIYVIPSGSMEPTLHGCAGCNGDRIAVEKITYYFRDPEPGDVVVFAGTDSWNTEFESQRSDNPVVRGLQTVGSYIGLVPPDENDLVKRIVATGGQTVQCREGDPGVMVDGQRVDDSFTLSPPQFMVDGPQASQECGGYYFGPIEVPAGHYFVMGDNRTNSADSRAHLSDHLNGTIPDDNIRGRVVAKIWPPSRIGGVESLDIQPRQE